MIDELLKFIICPSCKKSNFEHIVFSKEDDLIIEGGLICVACNDLFIIQNGILCILPSRIADKEREIEFLEKQKVKIPIESFKKRFYELSSEVKKNSKEEWIVYEKQYWDKKGQFNLTKKPSYSFNRSGVRNKHILKYLKTNIKDKYLIEFGAGFAETVYFDLNPLTYKYNYFCTDISFKELQKARWLHKNAICIQCDAINPPFKENSFDIILNFGALHHLPDNLEVIRKQIALLKSEGIFAMHEPINRRKAFLSKYRIFKKMKNKQSEHNDFIDEKETIKLLQEQGEIVNIKIEYSPVRNWLIKIFKDIFRVNNEFITAAIIKLDDFTISKIGKRFNSFDGNSILLLWKKCR